MRLLLTISIVTFTFFSAEAKKAPADQKAFNVTCPAKRICPELESNLEHCQKNQPHFCEALVVNLKDLVPEFDCQRPFDATAGGNYIVSAFWLCPEKVTQSAVEMLKNMKSKDARALLDNKDFKLILEQYSSLR